MSRALQTLALGVSLLIGQQALAQSVPLPQPVPFPAGGIPQPSANNGGLILTLYDITNTNSLTLYTGLNLNDILPASNMQSTSGLVLDFGEVAGFDALLANGSTLANLRYAVFAADSDATGGATNTAIATTGPTSGTFPTTPRSAAVATAVGAVNTFLTTINNPSNGCNVNPCTGIDAEAALGSAFFTAPLAPVASVGNALAFYLIDHSGSVAIGPAGNANVTRYQNSATSFGQWLLSSTGVLQYTLAAAETTVVPLPAAVWLLLSGLGGIGLIRRRAA